MNRMSVSLPTALLAIAFLTSSTRGQESSESDANSGAAVAAPAGGLSGSGPKGKSAGNSAIDEQASRSGEKPQAMEESPLVRRLPRYFAAVVDSQQRAEIYRIRGVFREQILQLEQQLLEVRRAELEAVENVLSAEQLSAVNAKRAQAEMQSELRKTQAGQSMPTNAGTPIRKPTEAATEN